MQEHERRVFDEADALDERLARLAKFMEAEVFETLVSAEQERLRRQAEAMQDYSDVLHERIEAFTVGGGA